MAFTIGNIAAAETAWKQMAGALLAPQQVDLYQGATITVRLHVGTRRANEVDVTSGAASEGNLVATIDYDDWMTKAGRDPQKGDVIWWLGRRHAVMDAVAAAPAGNGIFYKAELQG